MSRKSGGVRFYDHVATSTNKTVDTTTEQALQHEDGKVEAGNQVSLDDLQAE